MRWQPELDEEEEQQYRTGFISDQTSYLRMQTQFELRDGIIDKKLLEKFSDDILALDKFSPLSNSPPSQIKIVRCRRLKRPLLREAGLYAEAIQSALDDVSDFQAFRGEEGFFQKAQITERHEIQQDASQSEKKAGFLSKGLFGRKKQEEEQPRLAVE